MLGHVSVEEPENEEWELSMLKLLLSVKGENPKSVSTVVSTCTTSDLTKTTRFLLIETPFPSSFYIKHNIMNVKHYECWTLCYQI